MDGTTLVDTLTDDLETELSRLGSSKWLYALTDGDMTGEAVRAAAAADAAAAAETFDAWGDDPDTFGALAAAATDRRDAVDADAAAPAARHTYHALADLDGVVPRLGGALGYLLVLDRTVGQMVGFFVGDADPSTANRFRDIRDGVDADRDRVVDALDETCGSDDWDRAAAAATAVVEATYDDYVERLESMGVKPKNVC
jgi:hypothetical protein